MDIRYWKKAIKYKLIRRRIIQRNPFKGIDQSVTYDKPIMYLFFVACGTNMGDHAIVRAETEYIQKCLGENVNIVEIKTSEVESAINYIMKNIRNQDLILFSGGGYIGDEYIEVYFPLKKILKKFKSYKTIILPQTVFFTNKHQENKFVELCKKHNKLKIFVREEKSFIILKKNGINSYLVPDIVLSQVPQKHNMKDRIWVCMRDDVEKKVSLSQKNQLKELLQEFGPVTVMDTVESKIFPFEQRFFYLDKMLQNFSNSKLVVTDRIHGMVFSYLTNTPCLVFGNYNHKVESEYEWIKDCGNILFMDTFDYEKIRSAISVLLCTDNSNNKSLVYKFSELAEVIKQYYEQQTI